MYIDIDIYRYRYILAASPIAERAAPAVAGRAKRAAAAVALCCFT